MNGSPVSLPPLYAILDVSLTEGLGVAPDTLFDLWLDAGIRLIQLRGKDMASGRLLALASPMADRARAAGATFVVNDRADVARWSGASGVHVGQDDLSPEDARLMLPEPALIGISTHTDAQLAAALETPADYVAIGPVFATTSKARPDPMVGLEGVRRAARLARTHARPRPLVAIGGIDESRALDVLAAGADTVAVIGALLVDDLAATATRMARELEGAGRKSMP